MVALIAAASPHDSASAAPGESLAPLAVVAASTTDAGREELARVRAVLQQLGPKLEDAAQWDAALTILDSPPFNSRDAFDAVFMRASKSLPANVTKIYGGDGGQWLGLKTEAVDALDAMGGELAFLVRQSAKGVVTATDSGDLFAFYRTVLEKMDQFEGLYTSEINKHITGGSYCDFSNAEVCDAP